MLVVAHRRSLASLTSSLSQREFLLSGGETEVQREVRRNTGMKHVPTYMSTVGRRLCNYKGFSIFSETGLLLFPLSLPTLNRLR
ncbi:hypothetical protein ACS0TY_020897 [Phlomoides rotata]